MGVLDDFRLKKAADKIATGIFELQNLGFTKEQITNGFQAQIEVFFKGVDVGNLEDGTELILP